MDVTGPRQSDCTAPAALCPACLRDAEPPEGAAVGNGAGLASHLQGLGFNAAEALQLTRDKRRRGTGRSDAADAELAARRAAAGCGTSTPEPRDGWAEAAHACRRDLSRHFDEGHERGKAPVQHGSRGDKVETLPYADPVDDGDALA